MLGGCSYDIVKFVMKLSVVENLKVTWNLKVTNVLYSCSRCKCKETDGNLLLNTLVIYTRHVWIVRYCSTKWELNRAQTIVLVGHGLGGLVIKSLIESFHFHEPAQKEQKARWEAFQQNIKGIVFYSVPHTTSQE